MMNDDDADGLRARMGRPAWAPGSPGGARRGRPVAPLTPAVARALNREGFSAGQIARAAGVSLATVKRRLGWQS